MSRSLTVRNLYDKKFNQFKFDGLYQRAMGNPESNGIWLIYGREKNGKTWWALMLANFISSLKKVLYISAEEGIGMDFVAACKRAKIDKSNSSLKFEEYMPFEELKEKIRKRKSAEVIVIDNTLIYSGEIRPSDLNKLKNEFPDKLFIILAHEERGEPYKALGKEAKKLAKIIMRVEGLAVHISGRCPGGVISIDENKAALFWGTEALAS